jgi:deoxyxylulose-5-phosphate synthase
LLVTMEDHVLAGGFGSAVLEALQEADCPTPVERIGWPDKFVEHGTNVDTPPRRLRSVARRHRPVLRSISPNCPNP